MHRIAILAPHGVIPFDLAMPLETFARVVDRHGKPAYDVRVVGEDVEVHAGHFTLKAGPTIADGIDADTLVVPGVHDPAAVSDRVIAWIAAAARRGVRIVSICSGAFLLAAAGVLEGRRATTHWAAVDAFAKAWPGITVMPNVLYVADGNVFTSAGATAGLDLCLHLIRCDLGSAAAADAARLALVPLVRDGGQAQFVKGRPLPRDGSLAPLAEWARTQAIGELNVAILARRAGVSVRTLTRRFQAELGASPQKFLLALAIDQAKALLESTRLSVDHVSDRCGFNSPVTFRTAFTRLVGVSPGRYRKSFDAA
ncbi:transcriptional regulator, AraC family with amidase-like domain [Massilia sp. PDC64]|nr:helix-turn-helix domain-containing protein [Massilia sp. PDC64]SDF32111.1 transcriptional regulator, AraC family with amidase-like domain [Massilia sp. PDC64]